MFKRDGKQKISSRGGILGGISGLAAAAAIAVVGLSAAPANAAPAPGEAFEIFYGQNCSGGSTASRSYDGSQHPTKEYWINDTFNSNRFGNAGYGQLIRNNAASIFLRGATAVYAGSGQSVVFIGSTRYNPDGECQNFPSWLRNNNVAFEM